MAPRANREYFRVRLHGFSVINLIALAIIVVCMVAGAESARETKVIKTSKSSKEKVRLSVMRLYSTSVQQWANSNRCVLWELRLVTSKAWKFAWMNTARSRVTCALSTIKTKTRRYLHSEVGFNYCGRYKITIHVLRHPYEVYPPSRCSWVCCQIMNEFNEVLAVSPDG